MYFTLLLICEGACFGNKDIFILLFQIKLFVFQLCFFCLEEKTSSAGMENNVWD